MTDMTLARALPGRHFPAQGRAISTAGHFPTLGKLIALPFDAGGTFDRASAWVKSGGSADSVMRVGLYDCDANGLPGDLILDCGECETGTSHEGEAEFPFGAEFPLCSPFWLVAAFGGEGAPYMAASAIPPSIEMQHLFGVGGGAISTGIFNAGANNAIIVDFEYGALPETFPAGGVIGGSTLWLSVQTPEA